MTNKYDEGKEENITAYLVFAGAVYFI